MKRLIALIISIAMVASLATGLAVTSFAATVVEGGTLDTDYSISDNTITVLQNFTCTNIRTTAGQDLVINIPAGKTLFVTRTDGNDAIYSDGELTISGSGKLEVISTGQAIAANNDITISGGTVNATSNGDGKHAIYSKGNITISGGTVNVIANNDSASAINSVGNITISSGKVVAIANGTGVSSHGIYGANGITISGGTVIATLSGSSSYGIGSGSGNVKISGGTITANLTGYSSRCICSGSGYVEISGGTVNATASGGMSRGIFASNNVIISGGTVNVKGTYGIYANTGNVEISSGTVTANGSDRGIYISKELIISGGKVTATASETNSKGIYVSEKNITISGGTVTANGKSHGIHVNSGDIIISNSNVSAKGSTAAYEIGYQKSIIVNGVTIVPSNYATYFDGASGMDQGKITGTDFVTVNIPSDPEDLDDEYIEENDPEVELDLGNGPVTLKTSNNSVVFNDTKVFEASIGDGDVFIPIDLSSAPKKIDGIFFNNEVYKYIDDSGKDIKLINRFAYAEVYTNKETGLNPLSLHLSDVSEIPGTCATAIQKKAMDTNKVYAEINYSFVSNGKPTENDAKIYVPVDGPAKVFYLFNENKIGIVPCEVKDGYCIFDRYFDGTYIVCADK